MMKPIFSVINYNKVKADINKVINSISNLEKNLSFLNTKFKNLRDNYLKQRDLYLKSIKIKDISVLNNANNYNDALYFYELKKYNSKCSQIEDEIKYKKLYLKRCQIYHNYIISNNNNNFLDINKYQYDFIEVIQEEFFLKISNIINKSNDELILNAKYKNLLMVMDKDSYNKYKKNLLNDEYIKKVNMEIEKLKNKKKKYVKYFFKISVVLTIDEIFFSYDILTIINNLYDKK